MNLMERIHGADIYREFNSTRQLDLSGWNSKDPIFEKLILELRPKLVIEVGTWKGASAIHMANMMKKHGVDGQIICVDTWLGAREFWVDKTDRRRFQSLECRNGYPSVYYTFLNNVCHTGHQHRIIPLPQTSAIAARLLSDIKADLIHIDGSHDEMDVLDDLWSYWPILRDGGVMFGDDYQPDWPGVVTAVDEFAKSHGVEVDTSENKRWILRA